VYIYPAYFKGFFKKWRTIVYTFLILIFLGLPWIKINHHSAILIDIVHRKFAIFGLTFWGHDAPILFLVLFIFVLLLGSITALFGRIWCGWMCPQTVFIEAVFRKIEVLIEGSPNDRKKLDQSPLTLKKMIKRSTKWIAYILISFVITHSFLAYLTGPETLQKMITSSPSAHPSAFALMLVANIVILFNFGWFREQFCIIACPYGRLQSVFMDPNSLVIAYDQKRGEPRKSTTTNTNEGDCINCYRCVQVCPTGIDIRRGVQLECIMCTACIDACDTVMEKINQPKGLIKYTTEQSLAGKKTNWFRPRIALYFLLILIASITLATIVSKRDLTPIFARNSKQSPYWALPTGEIVNTFTINIHNQHFETINITLSPDKSDPKSTKIKWITPTPTLRIAGGKNATQIVIIEFPKTSIQNGSAQLKVLKTITHPHHGLIKKIEEITLVGPLR